MGVPIVDDAVTGHPLSLGVLPSQLAAPAVASALMQQDDDTMAQLPAAHTPLLQSIMQRELQALSPGSRQLQLARCIQAQHLPSAAAAAAAEPPGCGHTRVQVVPLLGMCLMHLVSEQRLQGASTGAHSSSTHSAAAAAAKGGQVTPAELFASMLQVSPFLSALESELRSLHNGAASCYRNIKQQLAAVGQYLPPAAADESGRRSSTASSPDGPPLDGSRGRGEGSNSISFYGQGLDLHQLHQDADSAALDLVSLEDCISSNVTSLAQLAQQYDIMITAALAAAADHADPAGAPTQLQQQGQRVVAAPAALAPAAGGSKGGFLQNLLGAVLGRQAGSARKESGAVEYVFMSHGVCSHSNKAQLHSFHAGVPPDVYSSCIHKLLSHSSCSEHVLWMLSVINARLRYAADAAAAAGADRSLHGAGHAKQWTAPDKFTRSTTKYWVHPSNLLRLKLALTKQLPLLVYGADDPVSSGDIAAAAAEGADVAPASQQHKVTSLVSSVYFDGPELDVYHTRLARVDGARLVRVRYYGQRLTGEAGEQQTVFVEQKTHRDKTLGETSYKERASLQQSQLPAFLSGQVALEEVLGPNSKKLELMRQVQQSLIEAQQAPVMRSEYLRSAWQAYDNNEVRFSLDEHMLLLREAAPATSPGSSSSSSGSWCSPLESLEHLPACDAVRFPYAILEVKLQDKQAAPAWVHELQTSGVLVEVPRFSKFLHGMALLQPEKIRELPSWFVWREGEHVTLPATLDEVWDMMAERRAQKELEWQDLQDPLAAAAAAPSPDAAAMLVLLRAPRGYSSTAFDCLSHPADAASKLSLASAASFDLTATAATAPAPHPAAASDTAQALNAPSYPCHPIRRSATNSSNSHGTNTSSPDAVLLHGPARSIMQDGQFGCAGADSSSVPGGWHRGSGGGMQPLLGLVALPGRRDSWSCVRGTAQHMEGTAELGAAGTPCLGEVHGGSPAFGAHPLTVRVPPAHTRSLSSSSSLGSSDLHHTNSSSSMGPAAAEAALPHFTACSSSPSCCHSPLRPAYPRVDHTDHGRDPAHGPQDAARGAGAVRRPHSRGSSSGSWKLATTNPLFASGPLDRASLTAAAAAPAGAWCAESDRDAAFRVGDNNSNGISDAHWGASAAPVLKKPCYADAATVGAIKGGDVVLDLSRLTPQAAAVAAGAGRQQVIQVHYTGAVQAVPVNSSPAPSPRQVRELSLLLPAVAGGAAQAPELAAADAAELGAKEEDGMASCNGVAVGRAGAAAGRGQGKGSRGYRQRMQQWRAALGSRMKGLRGGKGKAAGAGLASTNDHMLGYGGAAPRQPTYVKPRADPKTFFANERTFLQWLQISVLVMMTGLGMLTGSTLALASGDTCMSNALCSASRISGAIISPVSILFMVYAIYLYRKRTRQLLLRSTLRYDDQRGPWVLTITLIAVTLIVIVLALQGFRTAGGRA